MALTLIKEDGSANPNANSYASVADGDAFADANLYSTKWTAANSTQKTAALVQASRLIDSEFQFYGYKQSQSQGLQWPRYQCPDPDSDERSIYSAGTGLQGAYLPENKVPKAVVDAACELAMRLLEGDRTVDASGAEGGLKSVELTGAVKVEFASGGDPLPVVPRTVQNALWKYSQPTSAKGGVVKLRRA